MRSWCSVWAGAASLTVLVACSDAGRQPEAAGGHGGAATPSGAGGAPLVAGSVSGAGSPGGGNVPDNSAGQAAASGGSAGEAGGAVSGGGASSAGGAVSGGGASSAGGASDGGPTVTWTAGDYASRKWARWPIPNAITSKLPHPMSFADEGETVRDQVTGLVWEKTPSTQTMTWQAALDHCLAKGAGFSLPTRIELTSIVDNTQPGAKVGSTLFVFDPKPGWTWVSTPWVVDSRKTVDPPLSWFINLSQGDSNNSLSQLAASAYARCVQVPATQLLPATHYVVSAGEVRDQYTGLSWTQAHSGNAPSLTAPQSADYCRALTLNGRAWRLPSLNELASVVDDVPSGNVSPAVDHAAFPGLSKDQWYWSASPHGASTTEGWMLNFMDGFTKHQATTTLGIALCVHD
jgi:hypothetical protein